MTFRVLVADDHEHAREGIRELLMLDSQFDLVGEAHNGIEAIEMTDRLDPDLILMDINMPLMNGLEATKRIKARHPSVKIIMITVSDDIADLFEALKKGAQGYLLKNLEPSVWLGYLKEVALDETPMSRELAVKLLHEFTQRERQSSKVTPLSEREQEVLEWVAMGHTNREIAENLYISENTVKNHLKNIMQKLHLENRVQLTSYAYEQGWIHKSKEKE
ncbi:DNA-binding response regulator [Effusibacillus lacus]|uniref:DNA-binding response regulator n=1 Tax=Effusibacillus lacus TaxID=1348429 RepID=A0A292YLH6_9BACL|nr:LuxR family two component transcriptional regulator [Effusibacillus lacus]GAX91957.1 DNA-binding response regulator [Effusibacillus lacus]